MSTQTTPPPIIRVSRCGSLTALRIKHDVFCRHQTGRAHNCKCMTTAKQSKTHEQTGNYLRMCSFFRLVVLIVHLYSDAILGVASITDLKSEIRFTVHWNCAVFVESCFKMGLTRDSNRPRQSDRQTDRQTRPDRASHAPFHTLFAFDDK